MTKKVDVLLVDDSPDGLIALEAVLANPHYNLVKAGSGMEALRLLPVHDFAIILLDVQMHGMNGFETASRIKMTEEYKHIPIIFVTAIDKDDRYVYKGYQSGAVDYIFKPYDENILRSKVAVFVDLYEKSKRVEEQAQLIKENAHNQRYLRLAQLEVESLKRYQKLADSIPHAVWRSKADGTMDYFNKVWTEYTGLSDQQSLGAGWQSAFDPGDLRNFLKTWIQKIGNSEDFQVECRIRDRNGEMRWHLIRAIAECRADGEITAWLGTCTNIHERKDMEENLIRARRQADAANVAKTSFLANMSHEIRTPLNSILGFTELLMSSQLSAEEQEENLATIKKNGGVLLKIIDEILDISKVEAGYLEMEQVEFNLNRFYQEIYALFAIQANEKKLEFGFRCKTGIPSRVVTDPTRYRQILVNIIGNSLKFTESGKVEIEVSWHPDKTSIHEGLLRCAVVDTGIGIDPAEANDLFQPFVQVDSSNTRRFGGAGLGLALSRRLAARLGGNVYIQKSERNKGSTFIVDIRVQTLAEVQKLYQIDVNVRESEDTSIEQNTSLKGARVLVVDDSKDNRNLISKFLKGAGAQVDCAIDGIDGVAQALTMKHQIVLMDIQMPRLDGLVATAQLRAQGYNRPIIALSAHALKQEMESSLKAGCNTHLTKPIDRRTLIDQVAKHIKGTPLQNNNKVEQLDILTHN